MCSRAVQTLRNHFKKLFFFPSQECTHWLYVIKWLIKSLNIYILALKAIIFRHIFSFKRKKTNAMKIEETNRTARRKMNAITLYKSAGFLHLAFNNPF